MDFKTFAASTPIISCQKLKKSALLSTASEAVNDSGYFTPSPVFLGKCLPGDSLNESVQESEGSSPNETPISTRLRVPSINWAHNDDNFTKLKTAFDDEPKNDLPSAKKQPNIATQPFDRLWCSNTSKSRTKHRYHTRQNRLVVLHDIGQLVGKDRVDIVKELNDLNLGDITSLILQFVDDSDLTAMCCASKQWNKCIMSNSLAKERRKVYLEIYTKDKENKVNELDSKPSMGTRKAFGSQLDDIQNVQSNRFEELEKVENDDPKLKHYKQFLEAGKLLKPNEMLDKCPRCASPAKVNSQQKRAICSVAGCEFDYCTLCRCEFNVRHHCSPVKVRPRRLDPPNKKKSKRFLRRLLS